MNPQENGTTLGMLDEVLARLERLEVVCGVMASVIARQPVVNTDIVTSLQLFAQTIGTERRAREHKDA
jgi:hypothetical protein